MQYVLCDRITLIQYEHKNTNEIMELLPSYNALLGLPTGVVHDILTCWLELKSVCKLDTAYCATQQRARFVELCQDKVVVFNLTPRIRSWDYIQWVVKRGFKISNV